MDNDYAGTLSTLTKYGTMNVSVARIPRKKRSRGNVAPPRTRCIALTDCISIMPDGTTKVFAPLGKTRKPNRVPSRYVTTIENRNSKNRASVIGKLPAIGDTNH